MPTLRFKDTDGKHFPPLDTGTLADFVVSHKGGASLKPSDFVDKGEYEVIPKKAITSGGKLQLDTQKPTYCSASTFESNKRCVVDSRYLITTLRSLVPSGSSIGYIVKYEGGKKYLLAQGVHGFEINQNLVDEFLIQYSNTPKFRLLMQTKKVGSTQVHIRNNDFFSTPITFPVIQEQIKIANFLSAIDEKISLLTKKNDLLAQYKKGVMQQIFNHELRFKDDEGRDFPEWELIELNKIATKVTSKNKNLKVSTVLTNSASQGIVRQTDYFDRDIANQNNLEGYYVVEVDDFVYNPRISAAAPVGPIKRNTLTTGVMSPLYTVFRFKEGCLDFFDHYFHTSLWHEYMKSVANSGARHDRMNISNENFFEVPVPYPSQLEQLKIARFLTAIDKKLSNSEAQLAAVKQYKQGLLQQMFV